MSTPRGGEVRYSREPFTPVPVWLLEARVSDAGLRVYVALGKWANDGSCFPSRRTVAEFVGKSVDTVDRAIKELAKLGALTVEARTDPATGERTSNRYILHDARPNTAPVRHPGRVDAATPGRVDAALTKTSPNQIETPPKAPGTGADQPGLGGELTLAASDGTPVPTAAQLVEEEFAAFWQAYPRKVGKPQARAAFRSVLKRERGGMDAVTDRVADGLKRWRAHWKAEGTDPRFIPHPATWLNQERYNDRPTTETKPRGGSR